MHTALEQVDKDWLPQMLHRQTSDKDIPGPQILVMGFKFPGGSENHFKWNEFYSLVSGVRFQVSAYEYQN
jgi:hypothetical protein